MAGEVHPVPFRTRKLSPPAPMVLRSKSVGEQDVADQRGAFSRSEGDRPRAGRPPCVWRGPWHAAASGLCPVASPRRLPVMLGSRSPTKFDRVWSAGAVSVGRGCLSSFCAEGPPGPALCVGRPGGPFCVVGRPGGPSPACAPPELCASRGGAPRPLRAAGRERILTPRATARRRMPAARARDEP